MFSAISFKLCRISLFEGVAVDDLYGSYTLDYSINRGNIYDCNGHKLVNEKQIKYVAVTPDNMLCSELSKYKLSAAQKSALKNGNPIMLKVDDDFVSRKIKCFFCNQRYDENSTAVHIIGYINSEGKGVCGIEKAFDNELLAEPLSVRFMKNSSGKMLAGIEAVQTEAKKCGSVKLTIDKYIQYAVENAMKKYIEKGAAVVLDNSSGKIKAICSVPSFEQQSPEKYLNSKNTPFINRALSAYNSGSVFKLSTAAAAVESNIDKSYFCSGGIDVGNVHFGCLKNHGKMNLETALAYSCNAYFISLGSIIGAKNEYRMAKLMGFGTENMLCSGITDASGSLNSLKDLQNNPASLANMSFGQGEVMTTPLQIASMIQCIANGGKRYVPSLVESVTDKNSKTKSMKQGEPIIVMNKHSADIIKKCMIACVDYGTGKNVKIKGLKVGGKTATAQTGAYDKNGKEFLQAWFAGFVESMDKSYSVVVMAEHGVTGGQSAGPAFMEICSKIA